MLVPHCSLQECFEHGILALAVCPNDRVQRQGQVRVRVRVGILIRGGFDMQGAVQQQQQQPITSGAAPYLSLGGSGGSGDPGDDQRPDPHAGLMASLGAPLG